MNKNFYTEKENGIIIRIKATPNSSKNEICGIYETENECALKVKIKAPAVENKANEELVKFFAKLLKVPKSTITFKSGETSKLKTLYIINCSIVNLRDICDKIDFNEILKQVQNDK